MDFLLDGSFANWKWSFKSRHNLRSEVLASKWKVTRPTRQVGLLPDCPVIRKFTKRFFALIVVAQSIGRTPGAGLLSSKQTTRLAKLPWDLRSKLDIQESARTPAPPNQEPG